MNHGNQHSSRKRGLMALLDLGRMALHAGDIDAARSCLYVYRLGYAQAPISTRRRWRCGR
jgi:hypothetical protein